MTNKNKKILIGVTGGIAAYKTCSLINQLKREGYEIKVIMTKAATKFVTPLTFQTLSNNPVYLDLFDVIDKTKVEHIDLADWCDIFVVAPATANTISKIALGIADNLLTTVIMALPQKIPVIIAPAMNVHMWENPIVQKNISELEKYKDKYIFVEPQEGKLACGYEGKGKLAKTEDIIKIIKKSS
ncbi:MAG: bifunctional phosphopantothenoylcysteine decarboxylase/phosphopantothenate--cysteine ligase CoaBC [bacterium]